MKSRPQHSWGRDHAALRTSAERFAIFPVFQVPGFQHVTDKPQETLVVDFLRQYPEKDLVIQAAKAVGDGCGSLGVSCYAVRV